MSLRLQAIDRETAFDFVRAHHRHLGPPLQWKFGVGVVNDRGDLVGVAIAGRPVARGLDDGRTIEITRCCTDGHRNAASKLYGAITRAAFALGFSRVVTYTLDEEAGVSANAAGFAFDGQTKGGSWDTPARARESNGPTCRKRRWVKVSG